jgi:hypothetical protein
MRELMQITVRQWSLLARENTFHEEPLKLNFLVSLKLYHVVLAIFPAGLFLFPHLDRLRNCPWP